MRGFGYNQRGWHSRTSTSGSTASAGLVSTTNSSKRKAPRHQCPEACPYGVYLSATKPPHPQSLGNCSRSVTNEK